MSREFTEAEKKMIDDYLFNARWILRRAKQLANPVMDGSHAKSDVIAKLFESLAERVTESTKKDFFNNSSGDMDFLKLAINKQLTRCKRLFEELSVLIDGILPMWLNDISEKVERNDDIKKSHEKQDGKEPIPGATKQLTWRLGQERMLGTPLPESLPSSPRVMNDVAQIPIPKPSWMKK